MRRSVSENSGLNPLLGPPIRSNGPDRVVGPGTQTVAAERFADCVAVGRRVGGRDQYCCTGTLIAPTVVVTAGHCFFCNGGGADNAVVYIGNDIDAAGRTVTGRAHRHPDYNSGQPNDLAVIVLSEPVTDVTPRPLATAEQIEAMTFGRVMGFGNSDFASEGGFGIKRMIDVPVASLDCSGSVAGTLGCDPGHELVAGFVGLGPDSCNGDSGGPLYALVGDDARDESAWALVGATSRATDAATRPCGDGGVYVRIGQFLDFIEEASDD